MLTMTLWISYHYNNFTDEQMKLRKVTELAQGSHSSHATNLGHRCQTHWLQSASS